jgi:DNA-binding MarR family transcriptional regulator
MPRPGLDDPRFPHTRVPRFINQKDFPGLRASIAGTYVAARSFAYLRSKRSDKFARCCASIRSIGAVFDQSESTVKRNLKWLEGAGLLYRTARFNTSSVITFVDCPDRFRRIRETEGFEVAKEDNDQRLEAITDEARVDGAAQARNRVRRPHTQSVSDRVLASPAQQLGPPVSQPPSIGEPTWVHERPTKNTAVEEQDIEEHDVGVKAPAPSPLEDSQANAKCNCNAETVAALFAAVRGMARKMPSATPMTARDREARWLELQRQRKVLLAEAEEEERRKKGLRSPHSAAADLVRTIETDHLQRGDQTS